MSDIIQPDPLRDDASKEAEEDLYRKSILQLVTDFHHETIQERPTEQNIMHANKRMVSMMGKVAIESQRTSARLERLTWALVFLTIVLVVLTVVLVFHP